MQQIAAAGLASRQAAARRADADADPASRPARPPSSTRGLAPLYVRARRRAAAGRRKRGDAIRAPPRAAGLRERDVLHRRRRASTGTQLRRPAGSLSLFAERQLIELRIPTGKPGDDGAEALQRYCARRRPTTC
ncbi:MAG: hypothetical protein MZV65_45345 [Chromatiales bacterium]|nr:hypothetical protein [Chromatiales bacterium]